MAPGWQGETEGGWGERGLCVRMEAEGGRISLGFCPAQALATFLPFGYFQSHGSWFDFGGISQNLSQAEG